MAEVINNSLFQNLSASILHDHQPTAAEAGPISVRKKTVGIVGGGNSAHSLACYLSSQGYPVHILVRDLKRMGSIVASGQIKAQGKLNGAFPVKRTTADAATFAANCEIIFVCTVTNAYADVARNLAQHLQAGSKIILFSGKFGGVLEFERVLKQSGAPEVTVLETDALFAGRIQPDQSIWIRGYKAWTLFSARSRSQTLAAQEVIKEFFPGLEPAENLVQRGLTDFGAFAHTLTMIANMNAIDRDQQFLFYYEGFTEKTIAILEQMESEFRNIAEAYGTTLIPMKELLNRYYTCDTNNGLLEAMKTVPNYRHSKSPDTLDHRFISEDVSCSLIPMQEIARVAGLHTPMIDSAISIASILTKQDFRKQGRTLEKLGLANMNREQIVEVLNA